jgi:hypothetical protein
MKTYYNHHPNCWRRLSKQPTWKQSRKWLPPKKQESRKEQKQPSKFWPGSSLRPQPKTPRTLPFFRRSLRTLLCRFRRSLRTLATCTRTFRSWRLSTSNLRAKMSLKILRTSNWSHPLTKRKYKCRKWWWSSIKSDMGLPRLRLSLNSGLLSTILISSLITPTLRILKTLKMFNCQTQTKIHWNRSQQRISITRSFRKNWSPSWDIDALSHYLR